MNGLDPPSAGALPAMPAAASPAGVAVDLNPDAGAELGRDGESGSSPVFDAAYGVWRLYGYAAVRAALNDRRLLIHKPLALGTAAQHLHDAEAGAAGPRRRRSRRIAPLSRVLGQQLAPRALQQRLEWIPDTVAEVLRAAERAGSVDLVPALAYPVPLRAMAELLGLPAADLLPLRPHFAAISHGHDLGVNERQKHQAQLALHSLTRWLAPRLRAPAREPLLAGMLDLAASEGHSVEQLAYWCLMLIYAGSATTQGLLANSIACLLAHPEQAHSLATATQFEAQLDMAIEELLRYEGPVRAVGRIVAEDLQIGTVRLTRGAIVYLMLAQANRDPTVFAAPETLDLRRTPNPHLSFGHGVTHCLGAHLARLELRRVLQALLPWLPRLQLDGEPGWSDYQVIRERARLPVRVCAADANRRDAVLRP